MFQPEGFVFSTRSCIIYLREILMVLGSRGIGSLDRVYEWSMWDISREVCLTWHLRGTAQFHMPCTVANLYFFGVKGEKSSQNDQQKKRALCTSKCWLALCRQKGGHQTCFGEHRLQSDLIKLNNWYLLLFLWSHLCSSQTQFPQHS